MLLSIISLIVLGVVNADLLCGEGYDCVPRENCDSDLVMIPGEHLCEQIDAVCCLDVGSGLQKHFNIPNQKFSPYRYLRNFKFPNQFSYKGTTEMLIEQSTEVAMSRYVDPYLNIKKNILPPPQYPYISKKTYILPNPNNNRYIFPLNHHILPNQITKKFVFPNPYTEKPYREQQRTEVHEQSTEIHFHEEQTEKYANSQNTVEVLNPSYFEKNNVNELVPINVIHNQEAVVLDPHMLPYCEQQGGHCVPNHLERIVCSQMLQGYAGCGEQAVCCFFTNMEKLKYIMNGRNLLKKVGAKSSRKSIDNM